MPGSSASGTDSGFPKHLSGSGARIKSEIISVEAPSQLILATMLGNMFKFLTLCVASHPHRYPDRQRLTLLKLLCRIGLDKNLRKQPNVEFQQLLLALLEGIQKWPEKVATSLASKLVNRVAALSVDNVQYILSNRCWIAVTLDTMKQKQ
ncbi:hypothetical protein JD844_031033 [Phrynosoma platyrhinos]|uniref:Coiled-coil SMC6 And NSE5 INteracting (CANIN) domain-containing protein n=1 Tax=Phrynosoma platyrhinos TaxID=52577 RepID=A0ABQ7T0K5_PHRPL|nr:hypothetical protein JD844_031033 [Phrynosoma platyrhinos]